jgi:DNA helicase HerA-like ATPase
MSGWLSTPELLAFTGWPLGAEVAVAGVEVGAARALPVPSSVPREGRRLFIGRDGSGAERPVALSAEAAKHHMVAAGISGSGKSTMLAGAALSDIEQGYAGVVIDPKSDLVETIVERVKPEHADRIEFWMQATTPDRFPVSMCCMAATLTPARMS